MNYVKLAKIFVPIGILIGTYFYGYRNGYTERDQRAAAELLAAKEKEVKQVTEQVKVNDKTVTRHVDVIRYVDKATPALIEEIKKEIRNENSACVLSPNVVRLYDDSNRLPNAGSAKGPTGKTN